MEMVKVQEKTLLNKLILTREILMEMAKVQERIL